MKLFKHKSKSEPQKEPYEYWKDPRLDDEGTYDYLVEELPKDTANWDFDFYGCRCDSCGKYRRVNFRSVHYFYCWDGWDSMDYNECWLCMFKDKIYSIKRKITKKPKAIFETLKLCFEYKTFKHFKMFYRIESR